MTGFTLSVYVERTGQLSLPAPGAASRAGLALSGGAHVVHVPCLPTDAAHMCQVTCTTFRRHNVSSYVACNGLLYTFTCQCTEGADWERDGAALREAARSFRLINSGAAAAGFPGRL